MGAICNSVDTAEENRLEQLNEARKELQPEAPQTQKEVKEDPNKHGSTSSMPNVSKTDLPPDIIVEKPNVHEQKPIEEKPMEVEKVEEVKAPLPEHPEFKSIAGALTTLSIGSCDHIWGTNAKHNVFKWAGDKWDFQEGIKLRQISVGIDGSVWGTNVSDEIYYLHEGAWKVMKGKLQVVTCGSKDHVWGVNDKGNSFQLVDNGDNWKCQNGKLNFISTNSKGDVWALDTSNSVYQWKDNKWSKQEVTLKHIDVSNDSHIRGVATNGDIMIKLASSTKWNVVKSFPKNVSYISSFDEKNIVALDADGKIHFALTDETKVLQKQLPPKVEEVVQKEIVFEAPKVEEQPKVKVGKSKFREIPGKLITLSIGSKSHIWGTNSKHNVFQWDGEKWDMKEGKLKQVECGVDGSVWGTNDADIIFYLEDGKWNTKKGKLKQVSCGSSEHVWGVQADGDIYQLVDNGDNWKQIKGKLKQVSVNGYGECVGVNDKGNAFKWKGDNWKVIGSGFQSINIANDGNIRGVSLTDEIMMRVRGGWKKITNFYPKDSFSISSHDSSNVVCLTKGNDIFFKVEQKEFREVPGKLKSLSIGGRDHVWGTNEKDNIFKWDGTKWNQIPGKLNVISVGDDGTCMGVNDAGKVFKWNGSKWDVFPGTLKHISVGNANVIWGLNNEGSCFQYQTDKWVKIPGTLTQLYANGKGYVVGCNEAGNAFKRKGDSWKQIAKDMSFMSIDHDGVIRGLDKDGEVMWIRSRNRVNKVTPLFPSKTKLFEIIDEENQACLDDEGKIFFKGFDD